MEKRWTWCATLFASRAHSVSRSLCLSVSETLCAYLSLCRRPPPPPSSVSFLQVSPRGAAEHGIDSVTDFFKENSSIIIIAFIMGTVRVQTQTHRHADTQTHRLSPSDDAAAARRCSVSSSRIWAIFWTRARSLARHVALCVAVAISVSDSGSVCPVLRQRACDGAPSLHR